MNCSNDGSCRTQKHCDCFENCTCLNECSCSDHCTCSFKCKCDLDSVENCACFEDNCECNNYCIHHCTCTHKENCLHKNCNLDEYCEIESEYHCELKKCFNFYCNKKLPQWVLDCSRGCCRNCDMNYGPITLDIIENCPICLKNKQLIKTDCNHIFCFNCYKLYCHQHINRTCPICRKQNWTNL
jgi:hypothetical protein